MRRNSTPPLILVVDDEPTNLTVLVDTLGEDYDIAVATSGAEALKYLDKGGRPSLILLDVMMPGMDGFDVCRRLKERVEWKDIPVVFVTAATTVEAERRGFEAGAVDYIHKPFDRGVVRARVRSHLVVHGMMERLEDTALDVRQTLPHNDDSAVTSSSPFLLSAMFEHATEGIMVFDYHGRVLSVNPSFERITGFRGDELIGNTRQALSGSLRRSEFSDHIWQQLMRVGRWRGELINRRRNGETYPELRTFNSVADQNQRVTHFVSVFSDISVTKKNQETIDFLTWCDGLTSLPNRLSLLQRLRFTLDHCQRNRVFSAIMVFDINRFKDVNESLGLVTGDEVLQGLAKRLKEGCNETEIAARLDGDEFAVLLTSPVENADQCGCRALARAQTFQAQLSQPYRIGDETIHLSMSFGLSVMPLEGTDSPEHALKAAETAHRRAKLQGSDAILFFQEKMTEESRDQFKIAQGLQNAIAKEGLEVYLQPQNSAEGRIEGFEALVRWPPPGESAISPGRFIPVAEANDLIVRLDRWVLKTVLRYIDVYRHALDGRRIAINISAQHFARTDFVDHIRDALDEVHLTGYHLTVELTESIMIQELNDVVAKMQALALMGIKLSIDDFGTGYSSLSYLRHLPIQELKIDQSFTSEIETSRSGRSLVTMIYNMARELGLTTIVEGVETNHQKQFLQSFSGIVMQGYLFGRPQPAADWLGSLKSDSNPNVGTA